MRSFLISILLGLFAYTGYAQPRTLIHCGFLLDPGVSEQLMESRTIVVVGNKVDTVTEGFLEGRADDTLIDLKSHYCMPGWIDSHTHILGQSGRNNFANQFRQSAPYAALYATQFAEKTIQKGFTTIRDLGGGKEGVNFALRDAINQGLITGPRIFVADVLSIMGGHGDITNGVREDLFGIPGIEEGVVDGPEAARKGARLAVKRGADLIKITATGGVLSIARDGSAAQFFEDELREIVAVAEGFGLTVAAHAHGDEGMQRAVRAGVSSIEHGTYMSAETMELMKERGTYYVPTIIAGRSVADSAKIDGFFVPVVAEKALEIGPVIQSTFAKAVEAGVPIAFGTDAGVFAHGENAKEFEYMVEAGMSPFEAIKAATYHAARLLKQDAHLGTLEEGKWADVIALTDNPLDDIQAVHSVDFVMKAGTTYRHPATP